MLIISSLSEAFDAYNTHQPTRVISLLSDGELMPEFDGLTPDHHLKLYLQDDASASTISAAAKSRAEKILEFIKDWDAATENMLIHCQRGVARSPAAAFVVMCATSAPGKEAQIARALREAAPCADPCPLLVAYADDLLERDGDMIDALDELAPPCTDMASPIVTLPLVA